MDLNFAPIARSGITQTEFGQLVGVARITVNGWVVGRSGVNRFNRNKVNSVLTALRLAVKNGDLPLPEDTPRDSRLKKIKAAVVKQLKALEPTQKVA